MSSLIFTGFDPLFDDACWPSTSSAAGLRPSTRSLDAFRPRLDIHESKDSILVTATFDLPGLASEDVAVDVHHDRLTVSSASSASDSRDEAGYAIRERRYGGFSRTLRLPPGTKPEDVVARMDNGLLTVTFPKAAPEQQPQRISIQ